jgi:hypothetical protein
MRNNGSAGHGNPRTSAAPYVDALFDEACDRNAESFRESRQGTQRRVNFTSFKLLPVTPVHASPVRGLFQRQVCPGPADAHIACKCTSKSPLANRHATTVETRSG